MAFVYHVEIPKHTWIRRLDQDQPLKCQQIVRVSCFG
jgi:hypothetical protein